MISLSHRWSPSVTKPLMATQLMLNGHLLIWRSVDGMLVIYYDDLVNVILVRCLDDFIILVYVSCLLIHLLVFWMAVGILTIYISYDEDFPLLMSFTSHWMHFILHVWSWPCVVFRLVGHAGAESWFSCVDFTFFLKKSSVSLFHFIFFKFLSLLSLCLSVSSLFPPLIHGWLYYH